MYSMRVGLNRRKIRLAIAIAILTVCFLIPRPQPAMAVDANQTRDICFIVGGSLLAAAAGYAIWLNRPGNDFKWSVRGPGGFYLGAAGGASLVGTTHWKIQVPGTTVNKNIPVQPSAMFNTKLGYFWHRFPYLGLEGEVTYARNPLLTQSIKLRQPIGGATIASCNDYFSTVSLVLRIMGRYGFLRDSEVPFGRLQPYVGIGPGLELIMGKDDTAKNMALETSVGVRYMLLKNLSTFVEYKFSYQWQVEINPRRFDLNGGPGTASGNYTFDYARHMIVVGFAFHFL